VALQKLSVVHVIDRLHTGGAERVLVTLANIFCKQGHRVKVVTITEQGPLANQLIPGIEIVNLGRAFKYSPLIMRRLISQLKGFDVVHVHSFYNLRYLWLAKMLFGLKQPVFYHEHLGFRANMQATAWQKYILPKTIFIATTVQINQWAVKQAGVEPKRVFTLPNIVLKEDIKLESREDGGPKVGKTESQESESWEDGSRKDRGEMGRNLTHNTPGINPRLVLVSNIRVEKNIEFAITLLQYLHIKGKKYHLTIVGKLSDMAYYDRLQKLVVETGTTDYITWVHNADSVQQLLPRFDIGLHTSPSESGPLAVIEYLAQGLPFVAYNTGEVITTIKQELSGCIAETFNPNEWEEKLQQLQSAAQQELKHQLQAVFEKHFSAEAYYQQCLGIYKTHATTPYAP